MKVVYSVSTVLKTVAPYLLLIIGVLWFLTTLPHIKKDVIKIWRGESAETKESSGKEEQMQGGNLVIELLLENRKLKNDKIALLEKQLEATGKDDDKKQ